MDELNSNDLGIIRSCVVQIINKLEELHPTNKNSNDKNYWGAILKDHLDLCKKLEIVLENTKTKEFNKFLLNLPTYK